MKQALSLLIVYFFVFVACVFSLCCCGQASAPMPEQIHKNCTAKIDAKDTLIISCVDGYELTDAKWTSDCALPAKVSNETDCSVQFGHGDVQAFCPNGSGGVSFVLEDACGNG